MNTLHIQKNRQDLSAYWMPFTANRQFKENRRILTHASGMYYTSENGEDILDGCAGLWCVNAGHGRAEIAEAARDQLLQLDYAPSFQMGHNNAFAFAERLAGLAPPGLEHVFLTNSGSESVDTALKIALAYQAARGQGQRTRLIGRDRGYHGVGFGGMSVGGLASNRRAFGGGLPYVAHLRHTHGISGNAFSKGLPPNGAEHADDLETLIGMYGSDTIAAVIVEPVAGSGGVLLPPQGYLQRLRAICDRHDILLIFDEVITGFGRLGGAFASSVFGVVPDIMTTAKGLTNGAVPAGAVFVRREIHDQFMHGPEAMIELFHGYTYSGHPVACAVGMATLDIYEQEGLFARAAEIAPYWQEALHTLADAPHVKDIRTLGLLAGIELEPRLGAPGARTYEVFLHCFNSGVLVRFTADTIALSPPLIVEQTHIDQIVETIRSGLSKVT